MILTSYHCGIRPLEGRTPDLELNRDRCVNQCRSSYNSGSPYVYTRPLDLLGQVSSVTTVTPPTAQAYQGLSSVGVTQVTGIYGGILVGLTPPSPARFNNPRVECPDLVGHVGWRTEWDKVAQSRTRWTQGGAGRGRAWQVRTCVGVRTCVHIWAKMSDLCGICVGYVWVCVQMCMIVGVWDCTWWYVVVRASPHVRGVGRVRTCAHACAPDPSPT